MHPASFRSLNAQKESNKINTLLIGILMSIPTIIQSASNLQDVFLAKFSFIIRFLRGYNFFGCGSAAL